MSMGTSIPALMRKQKSFRESNEVKLESCHQPKCESSSILIVDDRSENLVALEAGLSARRYNIVKAHSGEEALRILLNRDISLILLDVQMPGLDGFETAQIIRARGKTDHMPMICINAANQASEHVQRGYEVGAIDYIFKPFTLETLRFKVEAFLRLYEDYKKMARVNARTERLQVVSEQLREEVSERIKITDAFHRVFQASPCLLGIFSIVHKRLAEVNQSWLNYTGYDHKKVRTHVDLREMITCCEPSHNCWIDGQLQDGLRNARITYLTTAREKRDAYLSTEKIELHQQPCLLIVITDITEQIQIEREMICLDQLQLVGEMAAGIGHEVRNPMTTVRGYLQMFQGKNEFAKYQEQFGTMIEELDRANAIITEFLTLAKDKVVEMKRGNLNDVIHALYPLLQADAFRRGHELRLETGNIAYSNFDEKEVRQLVLNLVRNGFEAIEERGKVIIRTYQENDSIILAIQDTGKGIPDEIMGRLGTPFVTTKDCGTGLGLSVCYRIADRHGAKIEVKTSSSGTTFFVKFNLLRQARRTC
jgi:two-component system, sporulation sensor kinase E